MSHVLSHKAWVSPVTAVSFAAVALTGLLLLFHVRAPGIKGVHEWMGVVMTAAAVFHLLLNGRTFLAHFRNGKAILAVVASIGLLLGLLFLPGEQRDSRGRPSRPVEATRQ